MIGSVAYAFEMIDIFMLYISIKEGFISPKTGYATRKVVLR